MVSLNEIAGNVLLFFLVFGMSATVDIRLLVAQLKNTKAIISSIFLQYVIFPMCGFLSVRFFELDRSVAIILLVVTCSPGGSYSNWWCSMFNADLALSVTITAISTLVSVVLMPMNLLIYSKFAFDADDELIQSMDFIALLIALIIVISAIGFGLLASAMFHSYRFNIMANKLGNYSGVSLLAYSVFMSNAGGETSMWEHPWQFYVAVSLPCFVGLVSGSIITSFLSLNKPERVTLSVECCYQNIGIATSVALSMFQGEEAARALAVPLFYGIVEVALLGPYCILCWKAGWTKAPRNVSFWTMISTSYEVLLEEHCKDLQAVEVSLPKNEHDVSEKINKLGDTIYIKFSVTDKEEEDYQAVSCMCIHLPDGPKEASGYQLPEVPEANDLQEYRIEACGHWLPEVVESKSDE